MPRLLISNHTPTKEGGVYLLDTDSSRLTKVCKTPARGLTRGPDGYYFVEDEGVIHHLDPESWKVTRRAETGFRWCHDLRYFDGEYVLVASRGNRVARLGSDLQVREVIQIIEDENDVCHANCVEQVNGGTLLCVFTLLPGKRADKRGTDSWRRDGKVLRVNWETKSYDVLYEPLSQPHSLVWREGTLFLCESYTSEVAALDLEDRTKKTLCRLHGFVRGLAFARDTAYVGISHHRVKGKTPWARLRHWLTSWNGVVEVDTTTWTVKRKVRVPGTQVYDVLLLEA